MINQYNLLPRADLLDLNFESIPKSVCCGLMTAESIDHNLTTPRARCLHGHSLEVQANIASGQPILCPICGSLTKVKEAGEPYELDDIAITYVPVSMVQPQSSEKLALEATEDDLDLSTPLMPTKDFNPTDLNKPDEEEIDERTEPIKGTNKSTSDVADSPERFDPPNLPGYEVMEELGRGGMGVVYKAYDEKHGRDVALKTLQRMSPDDIVRFKKEFRALTDIAHTNLATLYELLSDGTTWCLTMEILKGVGFLEYVWSEFDAINFEPTHRPIGESLAESPRLSRRRLNRLYEAMKQMAVGLDNLHRSGLLHSDIKPSNVIVTNESRLVLVDFGLIAEITKDERGRVPQVIQGTPQYMSPEQAACAPLSEASDWYAVGVMLYEVLTGRLPIRDNSLRIMLRKQYDTPTAPIKRQPSIPPELSELCMALLEIQPGNRPTAADVLRAVDATDLARSIEQLHPVASGQTIDLVGRENHLELLNQAFDDVRDGNTRSVFVHGRSGMGKSVLIRAFIDAIENRNDTIVLEGRCYEQESVPFKTLDCLIDSLVVYLGTLEDAEVIDLLPTDILPLARLFPVLGQVPGTTNTSQPSIKNSDQLELRQRAMTALRELLSNLSSIHPVVLYIDDMQWGDEDSSFLLADLMRPPESPRVLLLGSYRNEDVETSPSLLALADAYRKGLVVPHRCELAVDPLSREDATRLAIMLLGPAHTVAQRFADRIGQESRGSPFFVWELAQHIQGTADDSAGTLELDEVIWSRVRRLPESTRQLLEVFAVAGRPMRASEAFQAIDEVTHGPSLLAQLRTNNFVRTKDQENETIVETYHDRIRESVVNHLANAKVRGHYLKLALVIEQASNISVSDVQAHIASTTDFAQPGNTLDLDQRHWQRIFDLAHYFHAADKSERAMPYALIAAEQAWAQNAFDVAEQQFEMAKKGSESARDAIRFRIAEGLGDVVTIRGRYDQGNMQFQIARSLADDDMVLARIDGKRGDLCFKKGDMANSANHIERALTELGDPPPGNKFTQTIALLKEVCTQMLHTHFPRIFTERRSLDSTKCSMDLFRARLYDGLGYPYWFTQGPVPTLWTHLRHMNLAERYPPSQELGRAYAIHGVIATAIPLAARGSEYAEKSYRIHGDLGDRLGQGKARSFQTFSLLTLGRFRHGVETGQEAVRFLEQSGDVWEANMSRIILSYCMYFLGDLKNSFLESRRAYQIGKETGDNSAMAIALFFWAHSNPHALPAGALRAERERVRDDPLSSAAAIQGSGIELLLRDDDPRQAAIVLQESLDLARKRGFRNPCIFCGATWKATALRVVAEREAAGPARDKALNEAMKAVRGALKITRKYRTFRPRALRERAMIAFIKRQDEHTRRYFDESLHVAAMQEAAYEHATTLLARGKAGLEFDWPDAEQDVAAGIAEVTRIEAFRND